MDLQCHDANRDYVIVTWKPPNTTTESPVIGYFIDRWVPAAPFQGRRRP